LTEKKLHFVTRQSKIVSDDMEMVMKQIWPILISQLKLSLMQEYCYISMS